MKETEKGHHENLLKMGYRRKKSFNKEISYAENCSKVKEHKSEQWIEQHPIEYLVTVLKPVEKCEVMKWWK